MALISKSKIEKLLKTDTEDGLVITPILSESQIGSCTIDLRLGSVFKVDKRTRTAVVDPLDTRRPVHTFFDTTFRDMGESFILYPNQLVIAGSLEYIRVPKGLLGEINARSSFNRLGLNLTSIIQPGYAGIVPLELVNNSTNPIVLYPGIRIVQLKLFELDSTEGIETYSSSRIAKYRVSSGPQLSGLAADGDFKILRKFQTK